MKYLLLVVAFTTCYISATAQPDVKQIEQYVRQSSFGIDRDASAVVLFERIDIGMGIENQGYVRTYTVHKFIKVIKRDAFDAAEGTILGRKNSQNDQIYNVKGIAYNLVNDAIKQSSIPTGDYYKKKVTKNFEELTFTIPDVKEGTVLEYSYTQKTPLYFQIPVWEIQGPYPKLLSEYAITARNVPGYSTVMHVKPVLRDFNTFAEALNSKEEFCHLAGGGGYSVWFRKNIPSAKTESFVRNDENHKERMDVVLKIFSGMTGQVLSGTWEKYNEEFWMSDLVKRTRKDLGFYTDSAQSITRHDTCKLDKVRSVYKFVRNRCRLNNATNLAQDNLKDVFRGGEGNLLHINALLVAMLNAAGLEAYLLQTSTTSIVSPTKAYPMDMFNYVAAAVVIGDAYILLDASDKNNAFGMLPNSCYNGYSRVISEKGDVIELDPGFVEDANVHSVRISMPDDSTQKIEVVHKMGIPSSSMLRKKASLENDGKNDFFEKYIAELAENNEVITKSIENLEKPDTNLIIKYTYVVKTDKADKIFFATSFKKIVPNNPFKAKERIFPVEFPWRSNNAYHVTFTLPKNYMVDSVTTPLLMSLGENSMEYKKSVDYLADMNLLTVNISFKNPQVTYELDEYGILKQFYEDLVKQESKIIEIRKK